MADDELDPRIVALLGQLANPPPERPISCDKCGAEVMSPFDRALCAPCDDEWQSSMRQNSLRRRSADVETFRAFKRGDITRAVAESRAYDNVWMARACTAHEARAPKSKRDGVG